MTHSTYLKRDIQAALLEIGKDRDVFERVELSPEAVRRSVEKYRDLIPSALFDFWFDKHKDLERRVENLEFQGQELLASVQGFFKACIEASSIAGRQLCEAITQFQALSANQVRADLNIASLTVKMMILIKGDWNESQGPSESAMEQIRAMEDKLLSLEDRFVHPYRFCFAGTEIPVDIHTEVHWLLFDSRLDADSLVRDYPISVRC